MRFLKKNLKLLALFFCLMSVLAVVPLSVSAESDRVHDWLDLISDSEETLLEERLDSLSTSLGHDISIATTDTLDGKSIDLYTRDLFEYLDCGSGDDDSGILLVVYINKEDKYDRRYSFAIHGEADGIFTENDMTSLENAFVGYLSSGDYYDAFAAYADECEQIIIYDNRLTPVWIFISLAVGAAVGGIVIWSMSSKHKSVRAQRGSASYMLRNTFRLDRSRDVYLYSHVTRRVKPQNNSSSSSSSGGGRSSSGRSYGGRSGRF